MPWTDSDFCTGTGTSVVVASHDLLRLCFSSVCSTPWHSIWIFSRIKSREVQRMNGDMARDTALLSPSLGLTGYRSATLQTWPEVLFCACFSRGLSFLVSPEKEDPGGRASVILSCLLFQKWLYWEGGYTYEDPCSVGHQTLDKEHVDMCYLTLGKFN